MADKSDNHKDTEGTENIIDFAPYGWGVYELECVNCQKEWVSVAPAYITDINTCPYCDKNIDVYEPNFEESNNA